MLAIAFIAGGILCVALFIAGKCVGTYVVGSIEDDDDDE